VGLEPRRPLRQDRAVIILGIILVVIGLLVAKLAVLVTIGVIVLIVGLILLVLGHAGHPVGSRRHWY
jgi:uncharacterized membrane protein HdeD (DUF308 family)